MFENIAFPLRMRKLPEAAIGREVERVLEVVRLPDVAHRLPRALSGGQQQRIAIARCLVYNPALILMDEPLGALDKKLRDQMQLEIKQLHARLGITVLYVTHDQEEAMVMSDRVCLLQNGRIEQVGTPDELYFRPAGAFAADFLGESNLLDGTLDDVASGCVRVCGPAGAPIIAPCPAEVPPRGPVKVMVRPENLRFLGAGERAANQLEGTLEQVILAGSVTRYLVCLADGTRVRATRFTQRNAAVPLSGAGVRLGWSVEDTVLLPGP